MSYRVPQLIPISVFIAIIASAIFGYLYFGVTVDNAGYQEILERLHKKPAVIAYEAKQTRHGVFKELWYQKKDQRYKVVLKSKSAEMLLSGNSIFEKLSDVQCWIQEKIEGDTQDIRYVQADEAIYNYQENTLKAYNVNIELFRLPGTTFEPFHFDVNPVMTTYANEMDFSF
jgi:hypothetical protein